MFVLVFESSFWAFPTTLSREWWGALSAVSFFRSSKKGCRFHH
jgi:hypothetical protein